MRHCNSADADDDGDGVPDDEDTFPLDPGESVDADDDGIGDNADTDDDGDGVDDNDDLFPLDKARSTLTSYKFVPESAGDRVGASLASAGDLGTIASRSHSWKFAGTSFSQMGTSVSLGDFDGDGMSDLLIGVNNQVSTLAYLVPAASFFDGETVSLDTLSSRPGVYTLRVLDRSAAEVTAGAAGDVDGDGLDDFLLGLVPRAGRVDELAAAYLVTAADLPLLDLDDGELGGVIYLSEVVSLSVSLYSFGLTPSRDMAWCTVAKAELRSAKLGDASMRGSVTHTGTTSNAIRVCAHAPGIRTRPRANQNNLFFVHIDFLSCIRRRCYCRKNCAIGRGQ